jgi:hypothetical protein
MGGLTMSHLVVDLRSKPLFNGMVGVATSAAALIARTNGRTLEHGEQGVEGGLGFVLADPVGLDVVLLASLGVDLVVVRVVCSQPQRNHRL